jgi:signal peptidase I
LVERWAESYSPGDVVVFVKDERYFVRRVVAVGGDVAALRGGRLWLNGFEPEVEARPARGYVSGEPGREGQEARCDRALESVGFSSREVCLGGPDLAELQVAEGTYLALCDNRADCRADSRDLGVIPRGAIRGRVTHRRGGDLWQWEEL